MSFSRDDRDAADEDLVAEINVTPLTDIFLVLLIIFMVTSSALSQQGSNVSLPRGDAGPTTGTGVIVTATADRHLEVDGVAVTMDGLHTALANALRERSERSVILRGDRLMVLEQAVEIMAIARQAGAEKIAIATAPREGSSGDRR